MNARDIIRYWTLDDVTFHNVLILVNDGWELYEWKDNICTIICYISSHCHQFLMNSFFFWLFRQYKFFFVFIPQHILAIRMGRVSVLRHTVFVCRSSFRLKTHRFRLKTHSVRLKTHSFHLKTHSFRLKQCFFHNSIYIWSILLIFYDNDPWQRLNDNLWFLKIISLSVSRICHIAEYPRLYV